MKENAQVVGREFVQKDLRWSYLAIAGMLVVGAAVNVLLPHGWTVWPLVVAAALLLIVHEAAERNGQGIPPFHVYLLLISGIALWLMVGLLLSRLHPLVLMIGLLIPIYYGTKGYIKQREHARLLAKRRLEGRCIHCGAISDPNMVFCNECGEEADPDRTRLDRVLNIPRSTDAKNRARSALAPAPPTTTAKQKEQALIARHHRRVKR